MATREALSVRSGERNRYENGRQGTWALILAGGRGRRMQPQIARRLGEDRSKEFCTFVGTRSLLEHTMDRASALCSPERVVTVISRSQRPYTDEIPASRGLERTESPVEQPVARGTAQGIHWGLTHIVERDPDAAVVVLPSDHFVYPESEFLRCLDAAAEAADNTLVLRMNGVHWSDWGRDERLLETVEHLGWARSVRLPTVAAIQ